MEISFSFEKLEVWKLARELVNYVYDLTANFPKHERYGIANQFERSVCSVKTNLAEGAYRLSGKEQARFTEISYSSLMEVVSWAITCHDRKYISENELINIKQKAKHLSVKLSNFYKSQISKK